MSLRKKTFFGFAWMSLDVVMIRGLTFVASILLARILQPEEFGLIGMITIFIVLGETFIDSGLSESLIRTKKVKDIDLSSVFITNIVIGLFIYIILFFLAPLIAKFYHQQILIKLIRVYTLSFIFSALSSVQIAMLIKKMRFKRLATLNFPGAIIGSLVGIVSGYLGYGVWSIVIMYLTTRIIQTMLLWIFSSWSPSFRFSIQKIKYHLNFGYKLLISGIINSVFNNVYNVLIGKLFPIKFLGFYDRAFAFSQQPVSILSGIINKVTYPMLSLIQDDAAKISRIYKKLFQLTFFLATPIMIGLASIAKPLFLVILGAKWLNAVPYFQILCLASVFYPINALNLNILKVFGRTDLFLKLEIIKKGVVAITVLIGLYFGINGLLWSAVVSAFAALLINGFYSSLLINYSTRQQLLDMLPISLISFFMFVLMRTTLIKFTFESKILEIVLPLIIGSVFYIGISFLFQVSAIKHLKNKLIL